jgi:hypothetical protein
MASLRREIHSQDEFAELSNTIIKHRTPDDIKRLHDYLYDNPYQVLPTEKLSKLVKANIINLEYFDRISDNDFLYENIIPFIFEIVINQSENTINNILEFFDIYDFSSRLCFSSKKYKFYFWLEKNNLEHIFDDHLIKAYGFIRHIDITKRLPNGDYVVVNDTSNIDIYLAYQYREHIEREIEYFKNMIEPKSFKEIQRFYNIRSEGYYRKYVDKNIDIYQHVFSTSTNVYNNLCENIEHLYCNDIEIKDTGFYNLIKKIIRYYTDEGYIYINKYIKWNVIESGSELEESLFYSYSLVLNNFIYEYTPLIYENLDKEYIISNNRDFPNTSIVRVYRGAKLEDRASYLKGSILRYNSNSFLSFSADLDTAYNFSKGVIYVLELDLFTNIYIPLSDEITSIQDESEFLLPLGSEFLIKDTIYDDGFTYIIMSVHNQIFTQNLFEYKSYMNRSNILL